MNLKSTTVPTALAWALLASAAPLYAADVTFERLLNPEPHNWLMVHHDYGAQRFSKLEAINKSNVKNMKLLFAVAIGGTSPNEALEATPLVEDGFMYVVDGWGAVYKIDVRSGTQGRILWKMDPGQEKYGRIRGVALWGNLVISTTGKDGRVIATDKDSGKIVWDKNLNDQPEVELSSAPLALKDDIIVGASGGDQGVRDWIVSLDPKTGNVKWKTFAVPAPGEPGSETWKDKNNAWKTGGGGLWQTGSYDPDTKLTIWGTGNPWPLYDPEARPGDNLYTNSAVALDINTGKLVWHFQYLPNDSWDYDEIGIHMLYDEVINGEKRKVVAHFGRNGFYYSLDRANGSFIKSGQYVNELNWTKGLDPKTGKPVEYDPKLDLQRYIPETRALRADRGVMKRACPTWHGGVAHQPTAYNPVKHIAYGVGTEGCFSQEGAQVAYKGPDGGIDTPKSQQRKYTSDLYYGAMTAYDTTTHKVVAKAVTDIENRSGALVTAGGVVFTALQDGWLVAYDDEKLEELWRFNLGTPLKGAPVTYSIGPKQYLAVQTSGRHLHPVKFDKLESSSYMFVFALN